MKKDELDEFIEFFTSYLQRKGRDAATIERMVNNSKDFLKDEDD